MNGVQKVVARRGLVTQWVGETCIVLDAEQGQVHALDADVAQLWREITAGAPVDVRDLHLAEVVALLAARGLVEPAASPLDRGISRRRMLVGTAVTGVGLTGLTSLALPALAAAESFATADPYLWTDAAGSDGSFTIASGGSAYVTLVGGGGAGGGYPGQAGSAYYLSVANHTGASVTVDVYPGGPGSGSQPGVNGAAAADSQGGSASQNSGAGGAASILQIGGTTFAGAGGGGGGGGTNGYATGFSPTSANGASDANIYSGAGGGGFQASGGGGGVNGGTSDAALGGASGASAVLTGAAEGLTVTGSATAFSESPSAVVNDPASGNRLGARGDAFGFPTTAGTTGGILLSGTGVTPTGGSGTVSDP